MQDNEPINLTYGQLSDMVNRIEQIPPLYGVGAPTSSTPAFFLGQTYIDQETGKSYYCSGVEEESGDESGVIPAFIWKEGGKSYVAGQNVQINGNEISAADTTYTAGTGLSLNGTQFNVDTSTIAQKSDIKNATLTIQRNGSQVGTFSANASSNSTVNITVPTNNNELTNGAGYQTSSQVSTAIGVETTARQNADVNLQGQIDAIVASSDVKDIVGTKADLNNYDTTTLGDNDIIKVLADESQSNATTYYRWNATTQQFTLIGEEGPYYTKSQADTLLNAKQNTLTAGSNVQIVNDTISATDTTYTAGTGLSLTGTQFSVDTTTVATQSDLTAGLATKQDTLTAGSNIQINNNTISATDTTYSDFTGTDGTTAGEAGLVPAPATTDAGKFLSASGLWETVQSGGSSVIELTSADYNWNSVTGDSTTTPFDSVAIGLLDDGVYTCKDNVNIAIHPSPNFPTFTTISIIIVSKDSTSASVPNRRKVIYLRDDKLYVGTANFIDGTGSDYHYLLDQYSLTNSLTSSSTTTALTANQGKTLKDLIDSLIVKGAGAPTTSTVGTVGKLYEDTTNGDLYICTDATNPYVWEEVGAGGGGGPTVVQTTGTSTKDVMSQNAVTSMVYADPSTKKQIQIGANAYSQSGSGNSAVSIGAGAEGYGNRAIAIGGAGASGRYSSAGGQDAISIATNRGLASSPNSIFIGDYINSTPGEGAIAIGSNPAAEPAGSIALGAFASATAQGEMNIGVSNASQAASYGYSGTQYRLLTGLYDPQSDHDAATKGYVDTAVAGAGASAFTTNEWNALWA